MAALGVCLEKLTSKCLRKLLCSWTISTASRQLRSFQKADSVGRGASFYREEDRGAPNPQPLGLLVLPGGDSVPAEATNRDTSKQTRRSRTHLWRPSSSPLTFRCASDGSGWLLSALPILCGTTARCCDPVESKAQVVTVPLFDYCDAWPPARAAPRCLLTGKGYGEGLVLGDRL